jgi:hypothetical protein
MIANYACDCESQTKKRLAGFFFFFFFCELNGKVTMFVSSAIR